jgi:tetratricopeptide (TPR) repeat protein
MESFISGKDEGLIKMQDGNFEQAIADFTDVISKLNPTNDAEAVLKATCLLNRSGCNIELEKYDEAIKDADEVVKLYNQMRPEEEQKNYDMQKIQDDKLTIPLSLAYVRRGQVFERQGKLLDALQEYSVSTTLKFDGDGQIGIKSVFGHIGIPEIDQKDKDLAFFSAILAHLLSEINLLTALTNLMTFVSEGNPDEKWIVKINDAGCCRILYGALQLYIDNEMIAVGCITALRLLAEKGAADAFNGFMVLRVVADHWKLSVNIMGDILRFLALSPPQLMPYLARVDFIPVCIDALDLELKPEEFDCVFYLLFNLIETKHQLVQLGAEGAIEKAVNMKTRNALIFLSKACQLNENIHILERENGMDWVLDILEKQIEDKVIVGASTVIITQSFMTAAEDKETQYASPVPEEKLAERAKKVYQLLFPLATKFSKEPEMESNIFAALASCLEYAVDFARENRIIQAASIILTMNISDEGCALNIISLFYACTLYGMTEDLKNTKSAIPALLNALKEHPENTLLVERAVAVACEVDSPKKKELYAAAIKQQPNSPILKKYESIMQ